MLNNLRNFSKSKFAGVLIAIIIIPFVFWGMGSVFSGGNKNNVVKINNKNISVNDFTTHVRTLGISEDYIRDNLENNFLEKLLNDLISKEIILMEIDDKSLTLNDKILLKKIKSNPEFKDDKQNFSRLKYEKFLLENNVSAIEYEKKIRDSELQSDLFNYISGGLKSPDFFVKNLFIDETKEIEVEFINLEKIYKKEFSETEINRYIDENIDSLKEEYINFDYVKITPQKLLDINEFNNDFFNIIDDIENDILDNLKLTEIVQKYNIKPTQVLNFIPSNNDENFLKDIYNERNDNKIQVLDKEDFFLFYEIKSINSKLPDMSNEKNLVKIKNKLKSIEKFNFNKKILKKIETNNFSDEDFLNVVNKDKSQIKKKKIITQNDNSFFNIDSLKLLYTIPQNDYLLIVDNEKNVYLTKVTKFIYKNISENNDDFNKYFIKSNFKFKNYISESYDNHLNSKYKITINYNALEKIKNYFR